jgi:hypothetical protein
MLYGYAFGKGTRPSCRIKLYLDTITFAGGDVLAGPLGGGATTARFHAFETNRLRALVLEIKPMASHLAFNHIPKIVYRVREAQLRVAKQRNGYCQQLGGKNSDSHNGFGKI